MDSTLFPITFIAHLIFAIVSLLVFGVQYLFGKRTYHLLLAIAIPCTLIPYLDESNSTLFYMVGLFELIALAVIAILAVVYEQHEKKRLATQATGETQESAL